MIGRAENLYMLFAYVKAYKTLQFASRIVESSKSYWAAESWQKSTLAKTDIAVQSKTNNPSRQGLMHCIGVISVKSNG